MTTNEILWKIFQSKNCTRTDFCKMLGYKSSQSNMSQWLNGQTELSIDQLANFCKKLKINFEIKVDI